MKVNLLAVIAGVAVIAAGCVKTVSGNKAGTVPFVKDRFEARYERPPAQIFEAAKAVIAFNGTLVSESTLHGTNSVMALEGKVNKRRVWISVEPVDAKVSSMYVQARTSAGGTDLPLCHELDKQIALKLVR